MATAVERSILKLTERFAAQQLAITAPSAAGDSAAVHGHAALRSAAEAPATATSAASKDGTLQALRRTFHMPAGDFELILHRRPGHLVSDHLVIGRKGALRRAKLADPLAESPPELKLKGMAQDLNEIEMQAVAVCAMALALRCAPLMPVSLLSRCNCMVDAACFWLKQSPAQCVATGL